MQDEGPVLANPYCLFWRVSATGSVHSKGQAKTTLKSVRNQVWLLVLQLLSDKQGFARAVYLLLHGWTFETKMGILFRAFHLCRLVLSTCQWRYVCSVLSFSYYPWNLSSQILTQVSHRLNQLFNGSLYLLEKSKVLLFWQAQAIFWLYTSRC